MERDKDNETKDAHACSLVKTWLFDKWGWSGEVRFQDLDNLPG